MYVISIVSSSSSCLSTNIYPVFLVSTFLCAAFNCLAVVQSRSYSVFCVSSLQEMQDNYTFLLSVYEKLLERLQDGISLCDVYSFVSQFVEERRPDLKDYLTKNLG